jgi:hypothetical protein
MNKNSYLIGVPVAAVVPGSARNCSRYATGPGLGSLLAPS